MTDVLVFFSTIFILYYIVAWLLPKLLSWFIRRKYKLETRIGKIYLFSLQDVDIIINGFLIHIDKIDVRSSFLSSEVTKLLCLVVNEVRINKDIVYNVDPLVTQSDDNDIIRCSDVSFHNQKIPSIIITFAQFLAVNICTITATFVRPQSPEWALHATALNVQLDGLLVQNAKTLFVNVMTTCASAKLLRHAPSTPVTVSSTNEPRPASYLCRMSVALCLKIEFIAEGPLSVEKVCVITEQMKIVINNDLYSFIEQCYQCTTNGEIKRVSKRKSAHVYTLMHRFSSVIPKVIEIKSITSNLTSTKNNVQAEIDASLDTFLIKTCFIPNDVWTIFNSDRDILWPHMSLSFNLGVLNVKGDKNEVISLKELVLESKLKEKNMTISSLVNCLTTVYEHEDVHCWLITNFGYLFTQPQSSSSSCNNESEMLDTEKDGNWWNYLNLEISLQMFNVINYIRLCPNLSCGFDDIKLLFTCDALSSEAISLSKVTEQSDRCKLLSPYWRQNWIYELRMKFGWASLNYEIKHGVINSPEVEKYHIWGFPFVGRKCFVKVINCTSMKTIRIQSVIDTLRLEQTSTSDNFLRKVQKCLTDYDLVSELNVNEFKPDVVWDLTISNCNIFYMTEINVCMMIRIDLILLSSDKLKLHLMLEGFGINSIIIEATSKYYPCTHSQDMKGCLLKESAAQLEWNNDGTFSIELSNQIYHCCNDNLKLLTFFDIVTKIVLFEFHKYQTYNPKGHRRSFVHNKSR